MSPSKTIFICVNKKGGKACIGPQSRDIFRALRKRAQDRGGQVNVERGLCMGNCSHGPNVNIQGGPFFQEVGMDDVERILDAAE